MAVHTQISTDIFQKFFDKHYDYEKIGHFERAKPIVEGVENTNYEVETTKRKCVFTLYEGRVSREEIPPIHKYLLYLLGKSVEDIPFSVPKPLSGKNRKTFHRFTHIKNGEEVWDYAAITEFIEGNSINNGNIEPHHCEKVGKAMAQLHVAGKEFRGAMNTNLFSSDFLEASKDKILSDKNFEHNSKELGIQDDFLREQMEILKKDWTKIISSGTDMPQGIIHGDLFPDNVFFNKNQLIGIIDFYFSCEDFLCYDLAIALNAWCFDSEHIFQKERLKSLLSGYESVRPLLSIEKEYLPILANRSAFRFFLTRLEDWIFPPSTSHYVRKDPRHYMKRILFHLNHRSFDDYNLGAS